LLSFIRNVIWLADTNYRIDIENETVRALVAKGDLDELVAADQVRGVIRCNLELMEFRSSNVPLIHKRHFSAMTKALLFSLPPIVMM
jgi:hypothetical protein